MQLMENVIEKLSVSEIPEVEIPNENCDDKSKR